MSAKGKNRNQTGKGVKPEAARPEQVHALEEAESDEIVRDFLVESNENLDLLDRELVNLEKDPGNRDTLSSIFRTIHTIKGTRTPIRLPHR